MLFRRRSTTQEPPPKAKPALDRQIAIELGRVEEKLKEVRAGDGPIVVGPFAGEIGYELLYWVPFVRWVMANDPDLKARAVVVSRGGTRSWYGDYVQDYVDLYDLLSPVELLEQRESMKPREATAFDDRVVGMLEERYGRPFAGMIHPSLLYNLYFRLVKLDERVFARALRNWAGRLEGIAAIYEPIKSSLDVDLRAELPEDYVAVRFYFRPSFPDTAANRDFATRIIQTMAESVPVVLLNTRMELDEHTELMETGSAVTIDRLMTPSTNLQVQTAVVAGARAFVGTYGGLAYLAPSVRVPSLSFASLFEHVQPWHEILARAVFDQPGFAPLVSLRPGDLDLISLVMTPRDDAGELPERLTPAGTQRSS